MSNEEPEESPSVKLERVGAREGSHLPDENGPSMKPLSGGSVTASGAVNYSPERVLRDGIELINTFAKDLRKLNMGSERRKESWIKEVEGLMETALPKTIIAVCGATGAGKSTLLNAVLGDNILLTSGMQACTAVVTEISYLSGKGKDAKAHRKRKDIEAEICFLSREEWKAELEVLLEFMLDEDGTVGQSDDRENTHDIPWLKVHAVYPALTKEQLVRMTADEIIDSHQKAQGLFGKTKKIKAENSRTFETKVTEYINPKRGKTPSLWPLIRLMKIKCCSKILRCGATLVDLPGVEDANVARGAIAKEYLKNCNRIWIAAPIKRAVDNKVAKDLLGETFRSQLLMDGNYDSSHITFIPTHTDDVSCSEIIRSLGLEEDPELCGIETELANVDRELNDWKAKEKSAIKLAKTTIKKRDGVRESLGRLKRLLCAFEKEDEVEGPPVSLVMGHKRKGSEGGEPSPAKRQRQDSEARSLGHGTSDDDCGSPFGSLPDDEPMDEDSAEVASSSDDVDDAETEEVPSDAEASTTIDNDLPGSLNPEVIKLQIVSKEAEYTALEEQLKVAHNDEAAAKREKAFLEKTQEAIQMQKNKFCSLKRSEFSKQALKEDFRAGLRELDQEGEEGGNSDRRDYSTIDLPVFACSSRDYLRLSNLSKGDGAAQCFTTKADTGIPALQSWCHELTAAMRQGAARKFLQQLHTFATSIRSYVDEMDGFSLDDRLELRSKWHDDLEEENDEGDLTERGEAMKMDATIPSNESSRRGLRRRIREVMAQLVRDKVEVVKKQIHRKLKSKGILGADKAAADALRNCDAFAARPTRWNTYRAVLRNEGEWKLRDLNARLTNPLYQELAPTWGKLFESEPFASVAEDVHNAIVDLIEIPDEISTTSQSICRKQTEITLRHAKIAIDNIMDEFATDLTKRQKDISRNLISHVRTKLGPGYKLALEQRGKGSFVRQKEIIRTYVDGIRETMFHEGFVNQLLKLDEDIVTVGETLRDGLYEVADKVEVDMSILWEVPKGTTAQLKLRRNLLLIADKVLVQVKIWIEAAEKIRADKAYLSTSGSQYTEDALLSSPVKG